jgi:signal transduction histidine kinase/ligand-binding sensor domain-containing protein
MPRALPVVLVLVLGLAGGAQALDPQRAPSQYVLTTWGARDLSSSSVQALLQTRDRYVWLGTNTGLVRFDGARRMVFDHRRTPGFEDGGVSSLAEGADGSLYVGTTAGAVMRYHGGTFTRMAVPAGTGYVSALSWTRDGALWVGAHGRPVTRWRRGDLRVFTREQRVSSPLAIAEDGKGEVWVGTPGEGLFRFADGDFTRQAPAIDTVQALRFDRHGALWIGTPHGLWRLRQGELRRFSQLDGLSNDDISALLEDVHGNLWIGTAGGGLNRLHEGRFSRFTARDGLTNDHVRSLLEDHEGNLWVGTADGLNCMSEGRFITWGGREGLSDPAVTAVAEAGGGGVWIGMNSGSVARLQDGRLEHFDLPGGVGRDRVIALKEARDGVLWAALDDGRLFRVAGRAVTEVHPKPAGDEGKVRMVSEDEQGPLFFLSGMGWSRLQSGRPRDRAAIAQQEARPNSLRAGRMLPLSAERSRIGYVHVTYRDPSGTLWLGTSSGLVRQRGGEQRMFGPRDGLPRHRVRSLAGEPDGGLWIASSGGLVYFKDEVIRTVTTAQGLPENYLRLILDDGQGHLWIASAGYIFRVAKRELHEVLEGRRRELAPVIFDTSDGLRATEAALSNSPGFRGRDGRLWFATAQGVSVVDPARVSADAPAPPVRIESVSVDGSRATLAEYPPGRGEVTIEYTALAFRSWSKLAFRHRLEGLDPGWVTAENGRTAYYSTLPPGHYRFLVMASNRDGVWTGTPTSLAFTIRPPFYRTPPFYAACLAGALGLVFAVHRLRLRQIHARLTTVIDERTRIARELHDTLAQGLAGLGLQIDAALGILPQEPALLRVRRQLEQGLSMVRASLAEVRRSIWVLRAQTARDASGLASSLSQSLAQLTTDAGIGLSVQVSGEPGPVAPDLERSLLRIAHEAVTNAVRHAGAHTIAIGLHFDRDHLRLRVRDDGRGFDPEASPLKVRSDHFGLVGISERARSLGGELRLESHPGQGTEIDCRLPYRHPHWPPSGDEAEGDEERAGMGGP